MRKYYRMQYLNSPGDSERTDSVLLISRPDESSLVFLDLNQIAAAKKITNELNKLVKTLGRSQNETNS